MTDAGITAGIRFEHYDWRTQDCSGREAMLRFGPDEGPIVVVAPPLFEEANRTRAFAATICRALARRGVAGVIPDLPGQGESLVPLETITLATLRSAHRDLIDRLWAGHRHTYALGIRSGALLDADSHVYGRWYLAPQDGPALLRELTRTRQAALEPPSRLGEDWFLDLLDADGNDIPVEIAGNVIAPALLGALMDDASAPLGPTRTVRLSTDAAPADIKLDGAPLWRRSEPGNDLMLAGQVADDIAAWIARCEG